MSYSVPLRFYRSTKKIVWLQLVQILIVVAHYTIAHFSSPTSTETGTFIFVALFDVFMFSFFVFLMLYCIKNVIIKDKEAYTAMPLIGFILSSLISIGILPFTFLIMGIIENNVLPQASEMYWVPIQLIITVWCVKLSCQILWHTFFTAKDFTLSLTKYERENPQKRINSRKRKAVVIFKPMIGIIEGATMFALFYGLTVVCAQ
mgnify:CR=1 FL=1